MIRLINVRHCYGIRSGVNGVSTHLADSELSLVEKLTRDYQKVCCITIEGSQERPEDSIRLEVES